MKYGLRSRLRQRGWRWRASVTSEHLPCKVLHSVDRCICRVALRVKELLLVLPVQGQSISASYLQQTAAYSFYRRLACSHLKSRLPHWSRAINITEHSHFVQQDCHALLPRRLTPISSGAAAIRGRHAAAAIASHVRSSSDIKTDQHRSSLYSGQPGEGISPPRPAEWQHTSKQKYQGSRELGQGLREQACSTDHEKDIYGKHGRS